MEVLTPNTLEYDFSQGEGFCRGNQVKMRSLGGHWANMIGVLLKRGNLETDTHTQGEHLVKMKAELGAMAPQAKEHQRLATDPPEARRQAWTSFFLMVPGKEPTLPSP